MKDYITKGQRLNNLNQPKQKRKWVEGLLFMAAMLLLAVDITYIILGGA